MLKRLALAVVFAFLPTLALAQSAAPSATVCDGSEIRHAVQMATVGHALVGAAVVADVVAVLTIPHTPDGAAKAGDHFRVIALTAPVALAGLFIADRASPGKGFWQRVITRLKVGETTSADVRVCLPHPLVETRNGTEERWTYLMARPAGIGNRSLRSLDLTFRRGVLADVSTTEVKPSAILAARSDSLGAPLDRHHGFCAPPIPVIADPFPTPTDTSVGAAAVARAQADADAAMKNAAAAAAYAMCLASDSAR